VEICVLIELESIGKSILGTRMNTDYQDAKKYYNYCLRMSVWVCGYFECPLSFTLNMTDRLFALSCSLISSRKGSLVPTPLLTISPAAIPFETSSN
jgi:hypothetical protein